MASGPVVTVGNQPIVAVQAAVPTVPVDDTAKRHAKTYKYLGDAQGTIGVFCIVFAAIILILNHQIGFPISVSAAYSSPGIWCGIIFIVAGMLGMYSSKQPIPSRINACMALSIVAAIFAFIMICIEGTVAAASRSYLSFSFVSVYSRQRVDYNAVVTAIYAFHVILSILASIEFIVAIVHSAFCCAVTCCGNRYQPSTVITTTTTVQQPQMVVQPAYPAGVPPNQGYIPGAPAQPLTDMKYQQQPAYAPQQMYPPQQNFPPQLVGYPQQPQTGYLAQPGIPPERYAPPVDQPPAYQPPEEKSPIYENQA